MNRWALTGALVAMLGAPAAMAVEAAFIDGTYSTKEGCEWHAQDESKRDPDLNPILVTRSGLQEVEWNCRFTQIFEHEPDRSWVAIVLCEEPGFHYPEMLSLRRSEDGGFTMSVGNTEDAALEIVKCPGGR